MAIPTESDPVALTPEEEIKVIAIKLPFDLQERLLAFPFLHQIRSHYKNADLHFITPKHNIEVLNLLPFTAYYHEFDEGEIKTVFDVHPFTANAKIFNVDIYISLTNSFVDACLGLGLRAKKRVGFSDDWKTLVLTHKTPRPRGHHVTEDYFALYRELIGSEVDTKLRVMSRDLNPVIADWDSLPYIAINLAPLRSAIIEDELAELINYFENERIVLFASEDQEKFQLLLEPFLAKLSKKNIIIHFLYPSWIELGKMLAYARGVITFNGPLANLSAYVGAKTVVMYDSEDPRRYGPYYYLADSMILEVNDPTLVNSTAQTGLFQERKRFNMSEVFGKTFEFFKLVITR
jgi:ADP-heptose:LPS heptosyltransferase